MCNIGVWFSKLYKQSHRLFFAVGGNDLSIHLFKDFENESFSCYKKLIIDWRWTMSFILSTYPCKN